MADETLYVPTDASGTERVGDEALHWALPTLSEPGRLLGPEGAKPVLYSLDQLLDVLGERVFVAEPEPPRLVAETSWTIESAARFALDCAEHAVFDADELTLPSGSSLGDVIRAARQFVDRVAGESDASTGLLQRISRLAQARRLRHLGDEVADVARQLTLTDEEADLDALDDGAFSAVAAVRDAVLAAVETIRHVALPQLRESEEDRYERDAEVAVDVASPIYTPWGAFIAGGPRGAAPAWVTAREAAERSRQAAAEAHGAEAGAAERAWQLARLAEALGGA